MDFLEDFEIAVEHSKKTDEFVKGRIVIILTYILAYVRQLELVDLSDISMQVETLVYIVFALHTRDPRGVESGNSLGDFFWSIYRQNNHTSNYS